MIIMISASCDKWDFKAVTTLEYMRLLLLRSRSPAAFSFRCTQEGAKDVIREPRHGDLFVGLHTMVVAPSIVRRCEPSQCDIISWI